MRFFCSDLHFFHTGVLSFGKRPWTDLESMHAGLIENINNTVKKGDELWILGDFAFRNKKDDDLGKIFHDISKNKKVFLISGNHDNSHVLALPWSGVFNYKEIHENGENLILFHYPIRSWNKMFHGSYHLHGHEHGNVHDYSHFNTNLKKGGSCDVSVDCWNWCPITFEQIKERIQTKGILNPDLLDKTTGKDRTEKHLVKS